MDIFGLPMHLGNSHGTMGWIVAIQKFTEPMTPHATASQSAASKTLNNEKATDHIICCCVGVEPQCADGFSNVRP